jgi:hypothetical protein
VTFGAVVDRVYPDRERRAYELVLKKFDDMLRRVNKKLPAPQRGLVVHDERVLLEKSIQSWTADWREVAGKLGRLNNFADVPLFADSKASRLLQAADFVSWSLWRYYCVAPRDNRYVASLWPKFDTVGANLHGVIHVAPDYAKGTCNCMPCQSRLAAPTPARRSARAVATPAGPVVR